MACPLLKCVSPILTIKGCRNELGESHHALRSNHRFNLRLESPHPGLSKLPRIKITIHREHEEPIQSQLGILEEYLIPTIVSVRCGLVGGNQKDRSTFLRADARKSKSRIPPHQR
jgi:hypothetical protein